MIGFCCTLNGWMIGSAKDEHQIWDSSAILSSHILFVYTCGIYIYILYVCLLYIYIMFTVFHIIRTYNSHVFYSIQKPMIWRVCLGRSWPNGEGTPFLLVPGALFKYEIMLHSKDQEATTPNFNVNKQNSSTFCSVILFFDFPAALLYQIRPVRLESSEWTSVSRMFFS